MIAMSDMTSIHEPFDVARYLRVVDVWKAGNETGWITPATLYTPEPKGHAPAPSYGGECWWVDHGTASPGYNTLKYFAAGMSVTDRRFVCSHYLIPRNLTIYRDGQVHDTLDVVFKMAPDGVAVNQAGPCIYPISNSNSYGCEYESRQDGRADILETQYVKGALVYAYAAATLHLKDYRRVAHGLVRVPFGERTDPWAGRFDIAHSWALVDQIRRDARIWLLWGLPQPEGSW